MKYMLGISLIAVGTWLPALSMYAFGPACIISFTGGWLIGTALAEDFS